MVDVTIKGAGIFGLSIAWACLQRGAKVQVVDPYGVATGASGGIVGALAPHTPENWNDKKAFQFESLIMAQGFWDKVEAIGGQSSGYGRLGRLQPIADEKALTLAKTRAENAKTLWQDQATWQIIDAADRDAWAPVSPTGLLIYDTLSGRIHPRKACQALAQAILKSGGQIVTEAPDKGQIIWANGWKGLTDLSAGLGRNVGNGVKGQAALLKLDRSDLPQLFAETLHIIPHADGTIAIGSTSEREFEHPTQPDAQLDHVIDRALDAMPILKTAQVIEKWAGVRPRAKSRAPMLGNHPLKPQEFIANGGFKIGFGMAPKIAEVMTDLVLEGSDQIPEGFKTEASL